MGEWPQFQIAFQLLDYLHTNVGYPRAVCQYITSQWRTPAHIKFVLMFAGEGSHPGGIEFVEQCLQRIDHIMQQLAQPLEQQVL